MDVSNWWAVLTILCPVAYMSAFPLITYWYQYSKIRSTTLERSWDAPSNVNRSQLKTVICFVASTTVSLAFLTIPFLNPCVINIQNASTTQTMVALTAIVFFSVVIKNNFKRETSVEFVNVVLFAAISLCALLLSANALSAFLALELLGAVTLYGFFVFASYNATNNEQSSSYMALGCIYQFILNFIGSFVFYTAIALISSAHGTCSFGSPQNILADGFASNCLNLLILAIVIKLGVGPWIFYKFNVYKSFTVAMAALYTLIYFGGVIVFLYNFFGVFGIFINAFTKWCVVFLLLSSILIFGSNVFQTGSITLFLSFSSLLNLSFMLLQLSSM